MDEPARKITDIALAQPALQMTPLSFKKKGKKKGAGKNALRAHLESIGLSKYYERMKTFGVESVQDIKDLEKSDCVDEIGMTEVQAIALMQSV